MPCRTVPKRDRTPFHFNKLCALLGGTWWDLAPFFKASWANDGRSVFDLKLIDSPDRGGFEAIIGERFVDTRRTVVGMHSRMCFLSGFFDDGV